MINPEISAEDYALIGEPVRAKQLGATAFGLEVAAINIQRVSPSDAAHLRDRAAKLKARAKAIADEHSARPDVIAARERVNAAWDKASTTPDLIA